MTIRGWLEVQDGRAEDAIRQLLRHLLITHRIDALLAPVCVGNAVIPMLIEDDKAVSSCAVLEPVMSSNIATGLSRLTFADTGRRLGVFARNCELRAIVELTKLRQIRLEHVVLIGIDCMGTYEATDYARLKSQGMRPASLWEGAEKAEPVIAEGYTLRAACRICEHPFPSLAHLRFRLIGLAYPDYILVESTEDFGFSLRPLEGDLRTVEIMEETTADFVRRRIVLRDNAFAEWRSRVSSVSGLLAEFSRCIRCYNCMVMCPICYCKECVFRTPVFDHDSEQYFRWAARKGAIRMPTDTLMFHITRLNHMATSCVGCGVCDSACPNDLPVATLFRSVAERVQSLFDYQAGRSLDEEAPVSTFREDELPEYGV